MRIFWYTMYMTYQRKIISLVTALCLLANSAAFGMNLAAPLASNHIVKDKRLVLAEMMLQAYLKGINRFYGTFDHDRLVSKANMKQALERISALLETLEDNTIRERAGETPANDPVVVSLYHNRIRPINRVDQEKYGDDIYLSHIFMIPASVTMNGERIDCKLLFSTIKDDEENYRIVPYAEGTYEKLGADINRNARTGEGILAEPKSREPIPAKLSEATHNEFRIFNFYKKLEAELEKKTVLGIYAKVTGKDFNAIWNNADAYSVHPIVRGEAYRIIDERNTYVFLNKTDGKWIYGAPYGGTDPRITPGGGRTPVTEDSIVTKRTWLWSTKNTAWSKEGGPGLVTFVAGMTGVEGVQKEIAVNWYKSDGHYKHECITKDFSGLFHTRHEDRLAAKKATERRSAILSPQQGMETIQAVKEALAASEGPAVEHTRRTISDLFERLKNGSPENIKEKDSLRALHKISTLAEQRIAHHEGSVSNLNSASSVERLIICELLGLSKEDTGNLSVTSLNKEIHKKGRDSIKNTLEEKLNEDRRIKDTVLFALVKKIQAYVGDGKENFATMEWLPWIEKYLPDKNYHDVVRGWVMHAIPAVETILSNKFSELGIEPRSPTMDALLARNIRLIPKKYYNIDDSPVSEETSLDYNVLTRLLKARSIVPKDFTIGPYSGSAFIFSEQAAFDMGLILLLPKIMRSGTMVAVIAKTREEIDAVKALNRLLPEKERIIYASDVSSAQVKINDRRRSESKSNAERFYYFKLEVEEAPEDKSVSSISITKIIIDLLGQSCALDNVQINELYRAVESFA